MAKGEQIWSYLELHIFEGLPIANMYSKTFALDNYFMHIPEEQLDLGRQLLVQNPVTPEKEMKGNLWVFHWSSPEACETEISIGRKNVNAYSCDCTLFTSSKMCHHIAAALHYLNDAFFEKQKEKSSRHNRRDVLRQIRSKSVLDLLSSKELREFSLRQALSNPLYASALKTQFAYKVDLKDNLDKYYLLIKSHSKILGQGRLTKQNFGRLKKYLTDLIDHGTDLHAEKNYRESHLILYGLCKYIVAAQASFSQLPWIEMVGKLHRYLERIFSDDIPMELRKKGIRILTSLYRDEFYVILDSRDNLYTALYQLARDEKTEIHRDLCAYGLSNIENQAAQIAVFISCVTEKDWKHLERFLTVHLSRPNLLKRCFKEFDPQTDGRLIVKWAQFVYEKSEGKKLTDWAFDQMTKHETNKTRILDYYLQDLQRTKKSTHLESIRVLAGDQWVEVSDDLIKNFKSHPDMREVMLDLLLMKRDRKGLKHALREKMNMQELLKYAPDICEYDDEFVLSHLKILFTRYLKRHIGHQSAEFVIGSLRNLEIKGLHRQVVAIVRMISEDFSERTQLVKKLKTEF